MVGGTQKIRHIAPYGLIKENRERWHRLRQREHIGRRNRLSASFGRSLELKAGTLSDQARRRGVHPCRTLEPVKAFSKDAGACPSGDGQGRHQRNKRSIDIVNLRHSPPRKLPPTVSTDATEINPSVVDKPLKNLILRRFPVNECLQMLMNLGTGRRASSRRQV